MDSTLLKGLKVLEHVVAAGAPVGVSTLARALDLPKSNVHRTLNSLREAGYVLYSVEDRHYFPSLKLAQMGQRVAADFPFREAILPILNRLVEITGESAHFAFFDAGNVVFPANSSPTTGVVSVIPDNLALRWDDTAFGLSAVAALPAHRARAMLEETETSPEARAQIERAGETGYAMLPRHPGRRIFEIAAPIRSEWGTVIGTIGITGPAARFSEEKSLTDAEAVVALAADAFSETGRWTRTTTSQTHSDSQ